MKYEKREKSLLDSWGENRLPDWMLKKNGHKYIDQVLEPDAEEKEVRSKLKKDADFDLVLAEHRAKNIVTELGLDKPREGTDIYKGSSQFLVEMNLYNASRPLDNLMEKVATNMLAEEETEDKETKRSGSVNKGGSVRRAGTIKQSEPGLGSQRTLRKNPF